MADAPPSLPIYEVPWVRLFPWLRLFRCPGSAADPKRMMLAALGILLLQAGWAGLGRVKVIEYPGWTLGRLAEPPSLIVAPFQSAFDPSATARTFFVAVLAGLWALVVFGLIGGAIARVAVVDLTRGERVGLVEALRFSARKAVSLIGTPLVPMLGIVAVAAPVALMGLLYRLPGSFGAVVAGGLAFLPLIGGLLLTLIVIGLAVGWPLMHASVAAEAEDGFDAMSRAYAYVHQRPWHYAAYVALAALLGCAGLLFVDLFAALVVRLAAWSLSFGGPASVVQGYYLEPSRTSAAATAHAFWLAVVGLLVRGWVFSYFWTAATAIYLLLRRDIDGAPWGLIAYESRSTPFSEAAAGSVGGPHAVPLRKAHPEATATEPGESGQVADV